ncbi:MAG: purU [Sphingomonadales bacterium]|nr:purU [Sphingomonadales bacterium]
MAYESMRDTVRAIITLSCPNTRGIVAAVATFLANAGCNIIESQQFDDAISGTFFMRVVFDSEEERGLSALTTGFQPIAERYGMHVKIADATRRPRMLIMVSRFGHCLNDLLYRMSVNSLPIEIPVIVSNHNDLAPMAAAAAIPFVHIPMTTETKQDAEDRLRALVAEYACETVVLARYMQVLSEPFCRDMAGEIINIHHSFLPSFKGQSPITRLMRAA